MLLREYEKLLAKDNFEYFYENGYKYRKVEAQCDKCGKLLYINDSVVLTSYPPQFEYYCPNCKNIEYSTVSL